MDYRSLIQTSIKIKNNNNNNNFSINENYNINKNYFSDKNSNNNNNNQEANFKTEEKITHSSNPIEKYNYAIDQYNLPYNIIENKKLKKIKFEKIYNKFYSIFSNIILIILLFLIIPCLLIILEKFSFKKNFFFLKFFFQIYFSCLLIMNIIMLIIFIKGIFLHKKNSKIVKNPLKNMIFLPELCRLMNVNNKNFDLNEEDLKVFNFTEKQKKILLENSFIFFSSSLNFSDFSADCNILYGNRYIFTIYNQKFVDYFYDIRSYKYLIKHFFYIFMIIIFYLFYIKFINKVFI
jgi:hypothetical protein